MGDDTTTIIASNGNGIHNHVAKIEKVSNGKNNYNHHHPHHQNGNNNHLVMMKETVPETVVPPPQQFQPPDGGIRAWTILVSAFLCNGIIFGIINTYGVIYLQLQEQLQADGDKEASSKAALVGSLTIGATFLLSPVSGILVDMIGIQQTTIIGGVMCAGGMFISSFFIRNVGVLYFTYGILFGAGSALAYTPTLAILGHYFKKYLGVASGIVTAGSSVFTVILPHFLDHLIRTSLTQTFRYVALMTCFVIICGLLYKPLQPKPPPAVKKASRSRAHNLIRQLINFDNWKKKRYVIWALSIPIALLGYFVFYVHIGKFVKENFEGEDHNMPLMLLGISSCLGRLFFGYIADIPRINRIYLQQAAFTMMGITTMLLPATDSFILFCILAFVMGLFDGCFISLLGPIAYDICGQHGATQAIGFLLGMCSVPLTIGPPLAGMLYDTLGSSSGTWVRIFVLAGIPPIVGALCMMPIHYYKDDNKKNIVASNSNNVIHNGWVDPENLTETKLFLPKPMVAPPVATVDEKVCEQLNHRLASAESLNDGIDDHKL